MLRFDDAARRLTLGVHDVLDAGPPSGDLALQALWSARARMKAGQQIHTRYQASRASEDESFQSEVTIRHDLLVRDWDVRITGRIDGLSREGDVWVVEEVKSSAWPYARLESLGLDAFDGYVRQLQLYLYFLAGQGRPATGRLVLISVVDGWRKVLQVEPDPGISEWLVRQLDWIVLQREERLAWFARRRAAVVPFAHDGFRDGQLELSRTVEEAVERGRHLLLAAPTGLGKTAAVLLAALRSAFARDKSVFFATARTTQSRVVERTLEQMAERGLGVRAVSLRARDKVCLNDVVSCRPDTCRFAAGYHDKVRSGDLLARRWEGPLGGAEVVVQMGREHEVCPFALALDLSDQADVVIGDINYVFDPAVRLQRHFVDDPGRWVVVVDEAHNLPDRAMGYNSPELLLDDARGAQELEHPGAGPFVELASDVEQLLLAGGENGEHAVSLDDLPQGELLDLARRAEELALDYALLRAHDQLALFATAPSGGPDPWLQMCRGLARTRAALDRSGDETVAIWRPNGLKILCRDPSGLLGPMMSDLSAAVCMSATLEPPDFYEAMLGLDPGRAELARFASPFPPENRRVLVDARVSTLYRHRGRDREATARVVQDVIDSVPGNVAVYFSSFAFRDDIAGLLQLGARAVLVQERGMSEQQRTALIETMARGKGHVLLGVLGGIFSEGIDLPGDGLLAAVIVGPALPQVGIERHLMQDWYQERYGQGFRYAFLVPGMSRVVQAAGRVIRTGTDRGAVVLVGQRFVQRDYTALFADEWNAVRCNDPGAALRDFFGS